MTAVVTRVPSHKYGDAPRASMRRGGGAIELVMHTSSAPRPLPVNARWGDLGYLAAGVKAYHIEEVVQSLRLKGADFVTPLFTREVEQGGPGGPSS